MDEMKGRDYASCVSFEDLDGKVVSLAFNGRPDRKDFGTIGESLTYGVYTDCPVIDGDNVQRTDMQVVRNLRDALNKLNLGG
jgi:hypothetical protein